MRRYYIPIVMGPLGKRPNCSSQKISRGEQWKEGGYDFDFVVSYENPRFQFYYHVSTRVNVYICTLNCVRVRIAILKFDQSPSFHAVEAETHFLSRQKFYSDKTDR